MCFVAVWGDALTLKYLLRVIAAVYASVHVYPVCYRNAVYDLKTTVADDCAALL